MLNAKKFSIGIICICAATFFVLVSLNLTARFLWGNAKDLKNGRLYIMDGPDFYEKKAEYISRENLPYNAFIFGGSKAGAIHSEFLNEVTGCTFYNYWINSGSFEDYERYFSYLNKQYSGKIKRIILHLSSHEVERDKSSYDFIPFPMLGKYEIGAKIQYLKKESAKIFNISEFLTLYRNRDELSGKDKFFTNSDGSRSFSDWKREQHENADDFVEKNVVDYWGEYDDCLEKLFHSSADESVVACDSNIAALKRMKQTCDELGINLTVVIGPTFVSELYKYASQKYIRYLKDIVSVTPAWNFSGINDVNLNPYNFVDGGHYFDSVGNKMLEIMYSDSEPNQTDMNDFGILLTPQNIDRYIKSQRQKWAHLKTEYEIDGKIKLQSIADESYLVK